MSPIVAGPQLRLALSSALDDEWRARASYNAVIARFGRVDPFVRIAQAEQRHIDALLPLFRRYRIPLPADRWTGRIAAPATLREACEAGVAGEIGNFRMYDRLLDSVGEPNVRAVFIRLRDASALQHLPSFQACASSLSTHVSRSPRSAGSVTPDGSSSTWRSLLAGIAAGAALAYWLSPRHGVR